MTPFALQFKPVQCSEHAWLAFPVQPKPVRFHALRKSSSTLASTGDCAAAPVRKKPATAEHEEAEMKNSRSRERTSQKRGTEKRGREGPDIGDGAHRDGCDGTKNKTASGQAAKGSEADVAVDRFNCGCEALVMPPKTTKAPLLCARHHCLRGSKFCMSMASLLLLLLLLLSCAMPAMSSSPVSVEVSIDASSLRSPAPLGGFNLEWGGINASDAAYLEFVSSAPSPPPLLPAIPDALGWHSKPADSPPTLPGRHLLQLLELGGAALVVVVVGAA